MSGAARVFVRVRCGYPANTSESAFPTARRVPLANLTIGMEAALETGTSGPSGFLQTYPAVPESVAAIRAAVARLASDLDAPPQIVQAVALAASEAATNVVMHAYSGSAEPGNIEVIGAFAAHELVITVRDAGTGLRPRSDNPGLGLGLAIIARVSDHLDLVESPSGGVEVRMYFAFETGP